MLDGAPFVFLRTEKVKKTEGSNPGWEAGVLGDAEMNTKTQLQSYISYKRYEKETLQNKIHNVRWINVVVYNASLRI